MVALSRTKVALTVHLAFCSNVQAESVEHGGQGVELDPR